jgi:hypothetical protein
MYGHAHNYKVGTYKQYGNAANQAKLKPVIRFAAGGRFLPGF